MQPKLIYVTVFSQTNFFLEKFYVTFSWENENLTLYCETTTVKQTKILVSVLFFR